jgi:hypothetical protein
LRIPSIQASRYGDMPALMQGGDPSAVGCCGVAWAVVFHGVFVSLETIAAKAAGMSVFLLREFLF